MLTIGFADDAIIVNGECCPVPAERQQVERLLGKPDRETGTINLILTWDVLGMHAYQIPETELVRAFEIAFVKESLEFSPRETFPGVVMIDGTKVNSESTVRLINQSIQPKEFVLVEDEEGWWELEYGDCILYLTTEGPEAVVLNVQFDLQENDEEW